MTAVYQAIFDHDSGFPEDAVVNTFHFASPTVPATDFALDADAIEAFYTTTHSGVSIASQLGSRLAGTWRIKAYDLDDTPPRVPYGLRECTPITPAADCFPEEVAICLSYHAAIVSGQNRARRRGRIYIGPLALGTAAAGNSPFPSTSIRTLLATAAEAFVLDSTTGGRPWQIYSRTDDVAANIVGGWVDNTFDTQRRRGRVPTARTLWGD